MFWKFNLLSTSHIDTLLDKEDVTLHELMDEDDILQECKAQNRKLVSFLVQQEHMEELVKLITEEPSEEVEDKVKYKYPNTACELLTSDVSQINDALAGSEELVNKLYSFLDTDKTLNPLLASFFSKVMGLLITRKSEMILEFLKARDDFVGTLLKHIGTSAIMDLLLRLLTCIENPEIRRAMIEWLNEQQIAKKLVNCITQAYDEDIHCNAAQSLCDIIRLGREQVIQLQERASPDPLLMSVEKEETVSELLSNMLAGEKNESVIVNGLSVIQTLLEFKKQGPEDMTDTMSNQDAERIFLSANNVLTAIHPWLKDFHALLETPPEQRYSTMPCSAGNLDPPLGNTRLQTARLLTSLLQTNTHRINTELARLGTIKVLIDLCFRYIWNNFLHTHVTQCLYTILNNAPTEVDGKKESQLLSQLFTDANFLERILAEWEKNEQEQGQGGKRKGFMGHLTRIANDVITAQEKGENCELVKSLVDGSSDELKEKWSTFVSETLAETNKRNTVELVRGNPLASSSEDDDADFSNIPFPQDTAMQQAFSDYQLQQMTSNFIDQFGFNEEEFGEQEEKSDSPFTDRITSIDFGISVNEDSRAGASMFEQSCNERLQQFDNDSDEDIWEEKEITFSPQTFQGRATRQPWFRKSEVHDDSSDSEEELDSPKHIPQQPSAEKMDVDSNEAWTASLEPAPTTDGGPVAMDTSPWESNMNKDEGQTEKWASFSKTATDIASKEKEESTVAENWADFSNFANIKSDNPAPRSSSPVDMDTTETSGSSRTNAYLAGPSDLVLESVDASDEVEKSGTNTKEGVGQSSPQLSPRSQPGTAEGVQGAAAGASSPGRGSAPDSTGPVDQSTEAIPAADKPASPQPSESVVEEAPSLPQQPPPPPPPLEESHGAQSPPATPRGANTDCDPAPSHSPADTQAQGDGFLAKVGLLKPASETANCNSVSGVSDVNLNIQGNGPTNDNIGTSVDTLEELRCQAKDALESYDTAISTGASVQNGPV